MKKILITGATGFIGKHTIPLLLEKGYEVHAITSKDISVLKTKNLFWHKVNLLNPTETQLLIELEKPTHLLHLAWITTPGAYWTSLENLDWVEASIHLIKAFAVHGGKRVVVTGSCAEYDWNLTSFTVEDKNFIPATLYGSCKRALFLILNALCKQMNVSFSWGYIFFLYGPEEQPKRFVPAIINGLLKKEPVLCSEGTQIRDFLHTKDAADALVHLMESSIIGGINIGSGKELSLKKIAQTIANTTGGIELLKFGALNTPSNDPKYLVPNTNKLFNELGWRPKISLEDGLKEMVQWWKNKP